MSRLGRDLNGQLTALSCSVAELQRRATQESKAVDVLETELRRRAEAEPAHVKRNLVRALLLLHDHMIELEEKSADHEAIVAPLRQELLDVLYAEGVEPYVPSGKTFDRTRQHAVRQVPTEDPALDGVVEDQVREGFIDVDSGHTVRPARVTVFRFAIEGALPDPSTNS